MLIRFANLQTAMIVLVSVIALFFFPAPRGSFVSTHGPMTELCERCEVAVLRASLLAGNLSALNRRLAVALAAMANWLRPSAIESFAAVDLRGFSVLRI